MIEWTQGERLRFITLTLRRADQPLNSTLNHLLASFRRLREQNFWCKSVRAGTAVVEITRGSDGKHWHVHLHVLTVGMWMDQAELSSGWEKASGGSKIVDVRAVRDHSIGVGYVAKYATKGWDKSVLENADALIECVCALRGRRLLIHFGEWYGREDQLCKVRATDWRGVGRIEHIYRDSLSGQAWAIAALRGIGYAAGEVNGQPVFVGAVAPWDGP